VWQLQSEQLHILLGNFLHFYTIAACLASRANYPESVGSADHSFRKCRKCWKLFQAVDHVLSDQNTLEKKLMREKKELPNK